MAYRGRQGSRWRPHLWLWRDSIETAREPEAREFAERAVKVKKRMLGNESLELATSLNQLGNVWWQMADYAQARQVFEQAAGLCEKLGDPHDTELAANLNNLGTLLCQIGDNASARPLLERALASARRCFRWHDAAGSS